MEFILNMLTLKCLHNIRDDFQESMPMLGSEGQQQVLYLLAICILI